MTLSARAIALGANRPCPRLDAAATTGHSDITAAAHYGHKAKNPRLAYALGRAFERRLTGDEDALREITGAHGHIVTIPDEHADSQTWDTATGHMADPAVGLILQAVAPGEFGGWLRPDLLYRHDPAGPWHVGEIKVYLDKGGETDGHSFGAAVAQAAASVLTLSEAGYDVSTRVLIVLTDLRGRPTARTVDCTGELERIRTFRARTGYRGDHTEPADLSTTGHIYSIRCVGACALADYCRDQAAQTAPWPSLTTDEITDTDLHEPGTWTHTGTLHARPLLDAPKDS